MKIKQNLKKWFLSFVRFTLSHCSTFMGDAYIVHLDRSQYKLENITSKSMDYFRAMELYNEYRKSCNWNLLQVSRVSLRTGKEKVILAIRW